MRRPTLAALAALAAATRDARTAHPLGNFSVNHLTEVAVSSDRIDVRYIVDAAEIPTLQKTADARAEVAAAEADRRRPRRRAHPGRTTTTQKPGQGGLKTTRTVIDLTAKSSGAKVVLKDDTFPGRVGWKAVVPKPGRETAMKFGRPRHRPHQRPARLPQGPARARPTCATPRSTSAPAPARSTRPARSGSTGTASTASPASSTTRPAADRSCSSPRSAGARSTRSRPVTARRWSPPIWSAREGKPRDAIALGAIVTATHTAGVFALGLITLGLSQYILPEDLFP